jgi:sRNA-binding carbon storage regulator CsrA
MLVLQRNANEFYVVGSGLTVSIARDPDTDNRIAGIANVDEMSFQDGRWIVGHALNGDQTDQGRHLSLAPRSIHLYRVTLYSYDRN